MKVIGLVIFVINDMGWWAITTKRRCDWSSLVAVVVGASRVLLVFGAGEVCSLCGPTSTKEVCRLCRRPHGQATFRNHASTNCS